MSVRVRGEEDVAAEGGFGVDGDGADAVVLVPTGEVSREEGADDLPGVVIGTSDHGPVGGWEIHV